MFIRGKNSEEKLALQRCCSTWDRCKIAISAHLLDGHVTVLDAQVQLGALLAGVGRLQRLGKLVADLLGGGLRRGLLLVLALRSKQCKPPSVPV